MVISPSRACQGLSNSSIKLSLADVCTSLLAGSWPLQLTFTWHSRVVKCTDRFIHTLHSESTWLWMIEGTLDIAAVWEKPADNGCTSRGCSFKGRAIHSCNWDLDNLLYHCGGGVSFTCVGEWAILPCALSIKLTVWVNVQTLLSKLTRGEHFAGNCRMVIETRIAINTCRPESTSLCWLGYFWWQNLFLLFIIGIFKTECNRFYFWSCWDNCFLKDLKLPSPRLFVGFKFIGVHTIQGNNKLGIHWRHKGSRFLSV